MKRSDFLKNLGLAAGGIFIPGNSYIETKNIKIYDNYIRGLQHYDFDTIKSNIKEGDELILKREQENLYDSFAIEIYFGKHKLGYIAAYENIVLANMIDANVTLNAFVSQKDLNKEFYETLAIEIYTTLICPSQKLINNILSEQRADDAPDIYRSDVYG